MRVSYIGNKGTNLERNANINEPIMASGPVQPRRPYQPWGPITYWESGRNSILNQLQLGFVRRYSSGLTFQFEYQFSRALNEFTFGDAPANNQNFRYDRGNQDAIRRHYAVTNYSYELPFGRGQRLLSGRQRRDGQDCRRLADCGHSDHGHRHALFGVIYSDTARLARQPRGHRDVVRAATPDNRSIDRWFAPEAFKTPQPFTFGNTARNALFGPGLVAWDSGILRTPDYGTAEIVLPCRVLQFAEPCQLHESGKEHQRSGFRRPHYGHRLRPHDPIRIASGLLIVNNPDGCGTRRNAIRAQSESTRTHPRTCSVAGR